MNSNQSATDSRVLDEEEKAIQIRMDAKQLWKALPGNRYSAEEIKEMSGKSGVVILPRWVRPAIHL